MSHNIDVPIIKNGKDICRLIFTKAEEEKYDIKIDSREKEFRVQVYKLLARRPVEIFQSDMTSYDKNHDISYHHGADNKPIVVHIKSKVREEGNLQYRTLPLTHILPPNANEKYPLPLLKLEIPGNVVETSSDYRKKNRHYPVDICNSNVVEVYMMNENHAKSTDLLQSFVEETQMIMPIDFFASNTILTGSQKMNTYIPHEPEERCVIINELDGMSLMIIFYPEPTLDRRRNALYYTFIENQHASDILLNTLFVVDRENGRMFYGGANRMDLGMLSGKVTDKDWMFGQMKNEDGKLVDRYRYTLSQKLYMDCKDDNSKEKEWLRKISVESAGRLYDLTVEHEKIQEKMKTDLLKKCKQFHDKLDSYLKQIQLKQRKEWDRVADYLIFARHNDECALYSLLARYLGMSGFQVGACMIKNIEEQELEKGIIHYWLLYDDNWNVDIFCDDLNPYVLDNEPKYESVQVTVGLDPVYTRPDIPCDTYRIKDRCGMTPIGYMRISDEQTVQMRQDMDGILEKAYAILNTEV